MSLQHQPFLIENNLRSLVSELFEFTLYSLYEEEDSVKVSTH